MSAPLLTLTLLGEDVVFERDSHTYIDQDGSKRMSVTQALQIAGLIDYSRVPEETLIAAQRRGILVHHATAVIDRGDSLEDYVIPREIEGYIEAHHAFVREMRFVPNPDWVERRMIVELFGHRVGMQPDVVGTIGRVPTLIERKATAQAHPAWGIQTAGYELGLRAAGIQIRQRMAVRLLPTGYYKLHPYEDRGDFDTFGDCYRLAAWKLKHRVAAL